MGDPSLGTDVLDPGSWRIHHTVMHIELGSDEVVTQAELHASPAGPGVPGPLVLDGRDLRTTRIAVDGAELDPGSCRMDERTLAIDIPPRPCVVSTRVTSIPGTPGAKGFVWSHDILSTNLEPEGFRRLTWFLDKPSNRSTFDVTLVGDSRRFPYLRCNGDFVGSGRDGSNHWMRFVDSIPKPSYLFSVVAGDLHTRSTEHTTRSGRRITLSVAAPPDLIDGADFALWVMPKVLAFDETQGGIEHDLDELIFVAVPGYPDATEYHGLMFFDPALLVADPRGHVDDDLMLVALNAAHEYGHHVRGNRVTLREWGELTLKEGLTVLTAQNDFRRHLFGPAARILDVLDLRRLQFPEEVTIGAPVMRREVADPTSLYTRTTYLKGAEIFGMVRTTLGEEAWRDVFKQFVLRYDLGSASVSDFLDVAVELFPVHTEKIRSIARWFFIPGRPSLEIAVENESLRLRRTDSLGDDPALGIPVIVGFRSEDGDALPVSIDGSSPSQIHTVHLDSRERTLAVSAGRPFVVSCLRGFSAPVDFDTSMGHTHLALLVEHEDDPFARWWAAQELMIRAVDSHRGGDDLATSAIVATLAEALTHALPHIDDPVLVAQLVSVPDEFMLGDREPVIDVDGVGAGLDHLRREMGRVLQDVLLEIWDRFGDNPSGETPRDIAVRMLVEPVLAPLLAAESAQGMAIALSDLDSLNPTRAVRAFTQLAHVDHVPFEELAARLYDRWKDAPKLIDRWLRAQSGARRSDTVARVRALASGPLYERNDRSRVMGVWFPFATRNRTAFHHPSGEGYRIFVDELGKLMPFNAGLAVRLVGDLLQFRRFDEKRSALMRIELERLAKMKDMPAFAVEIIENLLA